MIPPLAVRIPPVCLAGRLRLTCMMRMFLTLFASLLVVVGLFAAHFVLLKHTLNMHRAPGALLARQRGKTDVHIS